ncbi:siderophore-iron reductase, Fe-S cluster protein, partial [Pseudomonas syringae pv. tagetis]
MSLVHGLCESDWALVSGALQLRQASDGDPRSLSPRALLEEEVCEQLLETLGLVIGSPTQAITASL